MVEAHLIPATVARIAFHLEVTQMEVTRNNSKQTHYRGDVDYFSNLRPYRARCLRAIFG